MAPGETDEEGQLLEAVDLLGRLPESPRPRATMQTRSADPSPWPGFGGEHCSWPVWPGSPVPGTTDWGGGVRHRASRRCKGPKLAARLSRLPASLPLVLRCAQVPKLIGLHARPGVVSAPPPVQSCPISPRKTFFAHIPATGRYAATSASNRVAGTRDRLVATCFADIKLVASMAISDLTVEFRICNLQRHHLYVHGRGTWLCTCTEQSAAAQSRSRARFRPPTERRKSPPAADAVASIATLCIAEFSCAEIAK